MRKLSLWVAAVLLLVGAGMLLADVGSAGLWFAVIAVGAAIVAVSRPRKGPAAHR